MVYFITLFHTTSFRDVGGEHVISSVLSYYSKNLKWWISVRSWLQLSLKCGPVLKHSFIWQAKDNTSSRHVGGLTQRREVFNFGSSFYMCFLLSLSLPYVNWASQEGCFLYLRFSLKSSDLLLFYFHGLFPFLCLLDTTILDSSFPVLTT